MYNIIITINFRWNNDSFDLNMTIHLIYIQTFNLNSLLLVLCTKVKIYTLFIKDR